MKKHIFSLAILFLIACQKLVIVDLPEQTPRLTVTCFFTPDSIFKAKISVSQNFQSNENVPDINDVECYIIENDTKKIELHYDNGFYISQEHPQAGNIYKIVVKHKDFDSITAIDTLPANIPVFSIQNNFLTFFKSIVQVYSDVNIQLTDNESINNFYEIKIFHTDTFYILYGSDGRAITEEPCDADDTVMFDNALITTTIDPILQDQSMLSYYPTTLSFDDKDFNMSTHNFILRYPEVIYSPEEINPYLLIVSVKKTSRTYHKFRRSAVLQYYYQNRETMLDNIEPTQLYSNVNNGFGIFAGYLIKNDTVEVPNLTYSIDK